MSLFPEGGIARALEALPDLHREIEDKFTLPMRATMEMDVEDLQPLYIIAGKLAECSTNMDTRARFRRLRRAIETAKIIPVKV